MKRVFTTLDPLEAHAVRAALQAAGIQAEVQGEALAQARGEIPFDVSTGPTVWILDDRDEEQAAAVLAELRPPGSGGGATAAPWTCPGCREAVDGEFAACWNCGAERPEQA